MYDIDPQDVEPIYDPAINQQAFQQINKIVFIHKAISAPAARSSTVAK